MTGYSHLIYYQKAVSKFLPLAGKKKAAVGAGEEERRVAGEDRNLGNNVIIEPYLIKKTCLV